MHTSSHTASERLFFLDWVRIIAFFVLIAYHVGMYYVSWDWHVKSPATSSAIEPFMMLSSPWHLSLLFLVSGVASSFMLTRISAARFIGSRSLRLLVPLVFGMFVIVPPQAYFEVVEKVAYAGGYGEFMRLYVSGYGGFCRAADCLRMPTWNHLWFVAYLWAYTVVLGLLALTLGARVDAIARRLGQWLQGWRMIALPALALGLIRLALLSRFPTTHALLDDWFNNANYFFVFVLGALMARERGLWAGMEALRWQALAIALGCWAALVVYFALPESVAALPLMEVLRSIQRMVYALCAWCAIVAACGFAHRHLQFDSPKRRYLTQAVFPVYILHQTLIVMMAHWMKPAGLPPFVESLVLMVLTLCISLGVFELARRIRPLQLVLGIAPGARPAASRVRATGSAAALAA